MTTSARGDERGDLCGGKLRKLAAEGVSSWLDGIDRSLITSGRFAQLIQKIGIRGATSNPSWLAEMIAVDPAYHDQLVALANQDAGVDSVIRALSLHDARLACDGLLGLFTSTSGYDGHVSIDLDPGLAHDAVANVAAAVAVSAELERPNLMVKVPATIEGLVTIRDCLARGIGVHVTEIFSLYRYHQVVDAYFEGLESAGTAGLDLAALASVASLPVATFDAEVDAQLARRGGADARTLLGTAALASARLMYQEYEQRLGSPRWRDLQARGARPQRLMWMSTAKRSTGETTADYVDRIVAWGTISAMSLATLDATLRHGELRGDTLMGRSKAAQAVVDELGRLGVSYDAVVQKLEYESGKRMGRSWQELSTTVRKQLDFVAG